MKKSKIKESLETANDRFYKEIKKLFENYCSEKNNERKINKTNKK